MFFLELLRFLHLVIHLWALLSHLVPSEMSYISSWWLLLFLLCLSLPALCIVLLFFHSFQFFSSSFCHFLCTFSSPTFSYLSLLVFILPFLLFWFSLLSSPFLICIFNWLQDNSHSSTWKHTCSVFNHAQNFTNWIFTFKVTSRHQLWSLINAPMSWEVLSWFCSGWNFTFEHMRLGTPVCVVHLLKH